MQQDRRKPCHWGLKGHRWQVEALKRQLQLSGPITFLLEVSETKLPVDMKIKRLTLFSLSGKWLPGRTPSGCADKVWRVIYNACTSATKCSFC